MAHKTHNISKQIGNYNKNQMLTILRENGPISRVELSRLLGVSPAAITQNASKLLKNGIIRDCGAMRSDMGRKPILMELCGDFCYVLVADIVGGTLNVAIADLMGRIVRYSEEPVEFENGADAVIGQLLAALRNIIAKAMIPIDKIWTIVIGTYGIFDPEAGKSLCKFSLQGWEDIDIRARVYEEFKIETLVENDVDLDIIGERWRGAGKDYENILYVKLGQGLAARAFLQNRLLRGEHRMAGETGYMMPGPSTESTGSYEDMLCNDTVSQKYINLTGNNKVRTISDLYALAENGDGAAEAIKDKLLEQFAVVLLNSVSVLDPQVIILGGDACCFAEKEISVLKREIERYYPFSQHIIPSSLKKGACLYGAIKTGIDKLDERIVKTW